MEKTHKTIEKLPDCSGVYLFLDKKSKILYVGKATSLKNRVRSYFGANVLESRGTQIVRMVERAERVDFRTTASVLEALILEAKLIKEFKPSYNVRDKDDKSFNHLVITVHEMYPRLLTVRGKDLTTTLAQLKSMHAGERKKYKDPLVYGPFPHTGQFKEALKILRKIFPYYDTKQPVQLLREKKDRKVLFNESIGVYPKGGVTQKEYARTVRYLKTIFDGKLKTLLRTLKRDMYKLAKEESFEEAAVLKRQLFALQHIEDVSLLKRDMPSVDGTAYRVEAYDIAHLGGTDTVGVMVVVEGGVAVKSEYRTFTIRSATPGSDTGALEELLERRFAHPEWQYPKLMVLDGGKAQMNVARRVSKKIGVDIPLVAVTKDRHHRPSNLQGSLKVKNKYQNDILLANSEAHRFALSFHKKKRARRVRK